MADEIVVKKYANRRLYDVAAGAHITLAQIRQRIAAGAKVRVYDDQTGADITRTILVQILADQERNDQPILSVKLLESLIRFYGSGMQPMMTRYLEASVAAFLEQQAALQEHFQKILETSPVSTLMDLTRNNLDAWQKIQASWLSGLNELTSGKNSKQGKKNEH